MPLIALPPVADWTLAPGLETVSGVGIRLARTVDVLDEFDDGVLGSDWTALTGGSGTVVESGGVVALAAPASGDKANIYANAAPSRTSPMRVRVRAKAAETNKGASVISIYRNSGAPAATGGTACLDLSFRNSGKIILAYWNATSTMKAWNGTAWSTTIADLIPYSADAYYLFELVSDGTVWWVNVYDSNGVLLIATGAAPWSDVYAGAGTDWLMSRKLGGTYFIGTLTIDSIDYEIDSYVNTSPVAESPWIAIDQNTLDATTPFNIAENKLATLLGLSTGSIKGQYAINNGAYNGTWLTLAQLATALQGASITDHTNSFRPKLQFISDGTQAADILVAGYIQADVIEREFLLPLEVVDISTQHEVVEI